MNRARLRPLAEADLVDIWLYVARQSGDVDAADSLVDELTTRIELLATHPLIGSACPDLAERLRSFPVRRHLIFYTPDATGIVVERVLHGARDIAALFD